MRNTVLIVPGLHDSGPVHWQTWLQAQLPEARRVSGIDWHSPIVSSWATAVRANIDRSPGAIWLVAHSFGCLAAAFAAADRRDRVAGALLVAPADPARVDLAGIRTGETTKLIEGVEALLPDAFLPMASLVVASSNDPFLSLDKAKYWAQRWGSGLVCLNDAGHINAEAGYGPWPEGLALLRRLQAVHDEPLLGPICDGGRMPKRGDRTLARLRRATRIAPNLS